MASSIKKKILLAETPERSEGLRLALEGYVDIIVSSSLEDASRQIGKELDAVLCSVNFDDSRMFDLLQLLKQDSATRKIPFICLHTLDSALSTTCIRMTERAVALMGGDGFIELSGWRRDLGDEVALYKFRKYLLTFLSTPRR